MRTFGVQRGALLFGIGVNPGGKRRFQRLLLQLVNASTFTTGITSVRAALFSPAGEAK